MNRIINTELPEGYEEGMTLASVKAEKSTHYTSPPKMFTDVIHFESRQWKYSKCKGAG